jgi:addiction module RelE/StbE family toxin
MEIIWRSAALNNLEAIREFIAHDNTEAAIRMRASIRTAVSRLANYPDLGRAGRVEGTRELAIPHTPYLIAYRVIEDQVRILAIMHTSQQWPERF